MNKVKADAFVPNIDKRTAYNHLNPTNLERFVHLRVSIHIDRRLIIWQVFKVMWAEPRGKQRSYNRDIGTAYNYPREDRSYETEFYTGIRRFVVVAGGTSSSVCV